MKRFLSLFMLGLILTISPLSAASSITPSRSTSSASTQSTSCNCMAKTERLLREIQKAQEERAVLIHELKLYYTESENTSTIVSNCSLYGTPYAGPWIDLK